MLQSLKDSTRSSLETALFLKRGPKSFPNTSRAFIFSLLIPLLLIPLQIPIARVDPELSSYTLGILLVVLSYRILISTAFFLGGVWLLTWPLERKDRFYQFGTAYNWLGLVSYLLLLPYAGLILSGAYSAEELGYFLLLLIFIMLAITSFTAKHTLNVHWVVAILICVGALLADFLAAIMIGGLGSGGS